MHLSPDHTVMQTQTRQRRPKGSQSCSSVTAVLDHSHVRTLRAAQNFTNNNRLQLTQHAEPKGVTIIPNQDP